MTFMVDTVIAGNMLGADAVAAVAMGMPIIGLRAILVKNND
jgi:Na+-driven multidrug efflux pump